MANTFIIRGRVFFMTFLPQDIFCSVHIIWLCTLNPLTTDTSEMSPISLSFDDTETEALQESSNKPRIHIPITRKVCVCVCVRVHMCMHTYKYAYMDASTCKWEHTCMCVYTKCLVYQLSPTVLIHIRHWHSAHIGVSILKPLFGQESLCCT